MSLNADPQSASSFGTQPSWELAERLSDLLAESQSLEDVCREALRFSLAAVRRQAGALLVLRLDAPGPSLCLEQAAPPEWRSFYNQPQSELMLLVRSALESGQPKVLDPAAGQDGDRPGVLIPLMYQSIGQGVLMVVGPPCSLEEQELLLLLARPVGRALHQHLASRRLQDAAHQLAQLQDMMTRLGFNTQLDELEMQIVRGVTDILHAETGALMLREEDGPSGAWIKKTLTASGSWSYQVVLPGGGGLLVDCLQAGSPQVINDVPQDARFRPDQDGVSGLPVRSLVCAPLIARGEQQGALVVYNKIEADFDSYDLDLLAIAASMSAQAIFGTRLVQRHKVTAAELEANRWELLRSRNTLRTLFDSIPAAVYIVDQDYQLVAINMFCARRTGEAPKTLVGRKCYEALYGLSAPCPECLVYETLRTGQITERTTLLEGFDDEQVEWEVSTYPIQDEKGRIHQAILLEQDVTEKRRLETILAQSEKLAAVGQLAAGVAHEINNPLTAIVANAQMIQRELPPDHDLQESIDLIARAGARATQVVRNLLDFSRQERYHLASTDVNETIRRSLALLHHELLARSIELELELDEKLPRVLASHDHLQGVWLNLLMNSVDAIDRPDGRIKVKTYAHGNEVRVVIQDTGKGIPPDKLERVFDPFYTTKSAGRGTGLGLSVVQRIVRQHGGAVLVNSQVGRGTEFTVVLPLN